MTMFKSIVFHYQHFEFGCIIFKKLIFIYKIRFGLFKYSYDRVCIKQTFFTLDCFLFILNHRNLKIKTYKALIFILSHALNVEVNF